MALTKDELSDLRKLICMGWFNGNYNNGDRHFKLPLTEKVLDSISKLTDEEVRSEIISAKNAYSQERTKRIQDLQNQINDITAKNQSNSL